MDELAILRHQVSTERRHMAEVKNACRAALGVEHGAGCGTFFGAAAAYLGFIMRRFHAQDQVHVELLRARLPRTDASSHALLNDLNAMLVTSREALGTLEQSADPERGIREYVEFFDRALAKHRHALNPLLEKYYRIEDWRKASFVDADSILEEQDRFRAVQAVLPSGVRLDPGLSTDR